MFQSVEADSYSRSPDNTHATLTAVFAAERTRLVHLCAQLTGNAEVAEDLAQETMLEAWRNRWKIRELSDRDGLQKWLAAIARNICMRWVRGHSHDLAHLAPPRQYEDEKETTIEEVPDTYDIEIELERDELARLLDQALALLPETIRSVLIERYIHESSHAEITRRLGLSEDALVQRLYRGKLALRRVITRQLGDEASTYGIAPANEERTEQETRIWCPLCGARKLSRYHDPASGRTGFVCSYCLHIAATPHPQLLQNINSPRPLLTRQLALLHEYYNQAIHGRQSTCLICGGPTYNRICPPEEIPPQHRLPGMQTTYHGINITCMTCGFSDLNTLPHLTLDTPEARQFWRKHPRMRWQPGNEIEYAGQPALVGSFQSINELAQLDVIYQRDTLMVLKVHDNSK